ncbi:N-acetylmuramoyl-L-alanine amidase [Streptomyces sp. DT18]
MATPLSADRLLSALRAEGVTVVEHAGWRSHNRNAVGAWGPVNGVMIHHTASGDGQGIVDVCSAGRSDLPGPLCHGVIHKDGTVTLVGWGRANHAGVGDARALAAVVAESSTHPKPGAGTIDGNARFIGFECVNRGDGKDPWPEAQLDAIERASAAVCRFYGWGEHSVIGHLEWTNQKIDPRGFSMGSMRTRIAARLAGPASAKSPKTTPSTPTEEDPMAGITKADIYDAVWKTDKVPAPDTSTTLRTNPTWAPVSVLRDIANNVRAIRAAEAGQTAAITALAKLVGSGVDTATVVSAVEKAITDAVIDVNINTPKES